MFDDKELMGERGVRVLERWSAEKNRFGIPRGKHPIYLCGCGVNAQAMRTKTGDGPKSDVDLDRLLEDIKVVVRDGQELLKSSFTGVKERAIARAKTTDVTVREYPYQTLGIIFGVGLVVGLLCSGMFSRGEKVEED